MVRRRGRSGFVHCEEGQAIDRPSACTATCKRSCTPAMSPFVRNSRLGIASYRARIDLARMLKLKLLLWIVLHYPLMLRG